MVGNRWKLARNRGSIGAHLPLAICGVLAIGIVLLGKAESSVFYDVRAKLTDFAAPMLISLHGPVDAFERWAGSLTAVFTVYDMNLELRRENEELRKWQDVALSLEQRLRRYELLLNAVPDPQLSSVMARVIGQTSRPFVKTMIVNAGTEHNVEKGQVVLDDHGLIGRIYLAGERTSWVILLTDLNSRVPVVIKPSNRRAIITGDNTMTPRMELDIGSASVMPGDRVVSTGDGGLLPPDLPIGRVVQDANVFRVALYADPDLSDFVQIINYAGIGDPPFEVDGDLPVGPPRPVVRGVQDPGEQGVNEADGEPASSVRQARLEDGSAR